MHYTEIQVATKCETCKGNGFATRFTGEFWEAVDCTVCSGTGEGATKTVTASPRH